MVLKIFVNTIYCGFFNNLKYLYNMYVSYVDKIKILYYNKGGLKQGGI